MQHKEQVPTQQKLDLPVLPKKKGQNDRGKKKGGVKPKVRKKAGRSRGAPHLEGQKARKN